MFSEVVTKATKLAVVILLLAAGGWAQTPLAVRIKGNQKWPAEEADRLYLSACSIVQQEFGGRTIRPQITVVLGAERDEADVRSREIRLVRWNPYLFAQGVVVIAFQNLMPPDERLLAARRAVNWADSTVEIKEISK